MNGRHNYVYTNYANVHDSMNVRHNYGLHCTRQYERTPQLRSTLYTTYERTPQLRSILYTTVWTYATTTVYTVHDSMNVRHNYGLHCTRQYGRTPQLRSTLYTTV
ncbi:hypothetical protein J6590_021590 [Homalodisca vitripennis]|nr:hypothetical protein J6590_021590 [Homalodisca vitripennis]